MTNRHEHFVLLVEDDWDLRRALAREITDLGVEVIAVSNGKEALQTLATSPRPCLVLTDLRMPVLNGWNLLDAMDAELGMGEVPVAVITGSGVVDIPARATFVLRKPLQPASLVGVLRRACGLCGGNPVGP